ncbi:MAG: TIGR02757 family protein [Prevotella sp.]|nr:TIGR02757 family protein [Prevotella sp.]MCM1074821.1 TIGR02757 family protein [Ruminococcus sp.]
MEKSEPIKAKLDEAVGRINVPEFVNDDPVLFPRRFERHEDVEITAFLCAIIAWGRRPMILRDCERLLAEMRNEPLAYLKSGEWENLPDRQNIHRTMFAGHLKYLMRGFRRIYSEYGSMENFCAAVVPPASDSAPWIFGEALRRLLADENAGGDCRECIPTRMDKTALKRINMALRWLVRNDGIVDIGLWKTLRPSQLYIPLDVHVANTSRALGLLERHSNDRRAAELLTQTLRQYDAADPVKYDFALFGLGVSGGL